MSIALVVPSIGLRREHFSLNEVSEGVTLYFQQNDNLTGKATYRMRVGKVTPERLVFETENIAILK